MKQYKIALFIGRFQPFHKGHLYSLKKCLEIAEKVTIVVAKSNVSGTSDDPWDVRTRKMMVCEVIREAGMQKWIARICSCPDDPSDQKWVREIKKRAGKFDVVVSNNAWTLNVMKEAGYAILEPGLFNREELEGMKIRELMRKGDDAWRSRVPGEILPLLDKGKEALS